LNFNTDLWAAMPSFHYQTVVGINDAGKRKCGKQGKGQMGLKSATPLSKIFRRICVSPKSNKYVGKRM